MSEVNAMPGSVAAEINSLRQRLQDSAQESTKLKAKLRIALGCLHDVQRAKVDAALKAAGEEA